jgi:hypothetical protein
MHIGMHIVMHGLILLVEGLIKGDRAAWFGLVAIISYLGIALVHEWWKKMRRKRLPPDPSCSLLTGPPPR